MNMNEGNSETPTGALDALRRELQHIINMNDDTISEFTSLGNRIFGTRPEPEPGHEPGDALKRPDMSELTAVCERMNRQAAELRGLLDWFKEL